MCAANGIRTAQMLVGNEAVEKRATQKISEGKFVKC